MKGGIRSEAAVAGTTAAGEDEAQGSPHPRGHRSGDAGGGVGPGGLPLGSGAVESAARHVIQLRMKRPGMRWSDDGGRAIAALRARMRSDRPLTPAA